MKHRNNTVYKMSKKLQNTTPRYIVQKQEITTNEQLGQRTTGNKKETRSNKPQKIFQSTFNHLYICMGLQNQPNKESIQGVKYTGLYNNNKRR